MNLSHPTSRIFSLVVLGCLLWADTARALDPSPCGEGFECRRVGETSAVRTELPPSSKSWDIGLKSGLTSGQLTYEFVDPDDATQIMTTQETYGGLPFGVAISLAAASWLTLSPGLEGVFDLVHSQLTRKGIVLDGEFHLLGQARGVAGEGAPPTHTFSLLSRVAAQFYQAPGFSTYAEGSALEGSLGASYRLSLGKGASLSLNAIQSLVGFSMSDYRLTSRMTTMELGCRFLL